MPPGSEDVIGQAGEFLVWAALMTQSGGDLHVYLPILDRGLDALVHRRHDGSYLGVQVKTKSVPAGREAPIEVLESHLFTDDQLIIGMFFDGVALGPFSLVTDSATFKRKAGRVTDRGRVLLVADMPVRPDAHHKWSGEMVPVADLAQRLGAVPPAAITALPAIPPPDEDRIIGNIGELHVAERLSTLADCGCFRPFPDNETAELLVQRLATGRTIGIQVKTSQLDQPHAYRHILVNRSNFLPDPHTYVVALAWIKPERRFHPTCLVIPCDVLPSIAGTSGPYFELHFRPDGSSEPSKVDRFRIPLERLADEISARLRN